MFDILALISIICIIPMLQKLVAIFPSLMACLLRWKENINLQTSMKSRTGRDMLTAAMFIPFCLCVCRFRAYCPDFMQDMSESVRLWMTIGIFATYITLRISCRVIFRLHSTSSVTFKHATESVRTYFIILTLLLLATAGLLSLFDVTPSHIRTAMFWISGAMYLVFLLRKTQIFLSSCNLFVSFLYLCALEILPTGVLIASAVIF
jgi:hypothetical protein